MPPVHPDGLLEEAGRLRESRLGGLIEEAGPGSPRGQGDLLSGAGRLG